MTPTKAGTVEAQRRDLAECLDDLAPAAWEVASSSCTARTSRARPLGRCHPGA